MGGVAQTYGELVYNRDAWALGSDVSEDAARGHVLVRHASQEDRADFSTGAASDAYNFLGVVAQVYGGEAAGSATEETVDTLDARVEAVWGRNHPVKIEDSATVAYLDPLTFSTTGEGALRTAVAGEPIVAICKKAISSGTTDQTTICDVLPPSGIISGATELPVVTGLTALAGGGQTGATEATGTFSNYTTVATAFDSGILPTAVLGEVRTVKNSGAAILSMFPATGDSINALAVNLSVDVPVGGEMTFRAISATVWETIESYYSSAPTTQTGGFEFLGVDNASNVDVTLSNASHGQASVYSIKDSGQAAADLIPDNFFVLPQIAIGAESSDVIAATITVTDVGGGAISDEFDLECTLFEATGIEAVAAAFTLTDGGAGAVISTTGNARLFYRSDATGVAVLDVTDVATGSGKTMYLRVTVMGNAGAVRFMGGSNILAVVFD